MKLRSVGSALALSALACGFLGKKDEPAPPVEVPVEVPAPLPPAAPADDGAVAGGTSGTTSGGGIKVLSPNIQYIDAEIPEGANPGEVAEGYESLGKKGKITQDDCPAETTLTEKNNHEGHQVYCALSNGVRHGPWLMFHGNGKTKEVGPYVLGKRQGEFITWDRTGKMSSRYAWINGQPGTGKVY